MVSMKNPHDTNLIFDSKKLGEFDEKFQPYKKIHFF